MKITRDEARRIAELAHLEFDEAELERMAGEMTKILAYIETLPEEAPVRTPAPHAAELLREDVARTYPQIVEGFFVVPKVIE